MTKQQVVVGRVCSSSSNRFGGPRDDGHSSGCQNRMSGVGSSRHDWPSMWWGHRVLEFRIGGQSKIGHTAASVSQEPTDRPALIFLMQHQRESAVSLEYGTQENLSQSPALASCTTVYRPQKISGKYEHEKSPPP